MLEYPQSGKGIRGRRNIQASAYAVSIMELKYGKMTRETQYFSDPFEPEPSRAQWVERMR